MWLRQGLALPPFSWIRSPAAQDHSSSPEARLRLALEEMGGVYAAFGRYLSGRSDILPAADLRELSRIRLPLLKSGSLESCPETLSRIKNPQPIGHSLFSRAYGATLEGRGVTVEVYAEGPLMSSREWGDFHDGLKSLRGSPLERLLEESLLEDFRHWVSLHGDVRKKRRILENLKQVPAGCVTRAPELFDGLDGDRCLLYERLSGSTLNEVLNSEGEERLAALQKCCELFLEWSLFLGIVPVDFEPEGLLLTSDGTVGPQVWPAFETVPAELTFELLQYVTSCISGDQSRAVHMLGRMSSEHPDRFEEQTVWDELSAQQAQLDAESALPESGAALNDLWKALRGAGFKAPSFLTLFHRQAFFWGQNNTQWAPDTDLWSDSIWPVLGRLFRFQMSESLSVQRTKEWAVGSTLAFLGAVRQFGITLEQIRSNDLTVSIQMEQGSQSEDGRGNGLLLVGGVLTLAVFLIALQMAFSQTGAAGLLAAAVAGLSGLGLILNLARLN